MPKPLPSGWFPRRGEVYLVAMDKSRPAAVLSVDALNQYALDVCVIPFTTVSRKRFSLRVPVRPPEGGVRQDSWAKCDQVSTLEKADLIYPPLGVLSNSTMTAIEEGVRIAIGLMEI